MIVGVFGGGGGGGGAVVLLVILVSDWNMHPNESIDTRISPKMSVLMGLFLLITYFKAWLTVSPMMKAILFDFDGVVVQSEMLHKETFMELLAPSGVEVSDERWYREFAGTGSRHIFEVLAREYGIVADLDGLVARRKGIYEQRVRSGRLRETQGARGFLQRVRSLGMKTAIVSGSHRTNVQAALETLALEGYFDIIVSGDDLPERKPDPRPFLYAAERLGLKIGECLVIEDSFSGAKAARSAGAKLAIMASPLASSIAAGEPVIRDFTDPALLRMLGAAGLK